MNRTVMLLVSAALALALSGCGGHVSADSSAEAPPPASVEQAPDGRTAAVDHPEHFPLAAVSAHDTAQELRVTGTIAPDVSRNIPVVSLASGRVVDIRVRLGDRVDKGQLLMRIQSTEIAQAFSDYRQAAADATLARAQWGRAKLLFDKGAVARKDLEVAQDVDAKAALAVDTALTRLRVLGADSNHPSPVIDINAPASGIVTEQNVTSASGVKTLDNSPNLFTISDLSQVWILCDVYENDLPLVHPGDFAEVRLEAYPNLALRGRVTNISPALDPGTRTAKVRLEVRNPGMLRYGMFVTATFHAPVKEVHATVPAAAVVHLRGHDWVYMPDGGKRFRRVEVAGGRMLPGNRQEILSGLAPGQQVVANALVLQNTAEQE